MNIKQLLARVAAQLDEDFLAEDARALALSYMNEAYADLMKVYRPYIDVIAVAEDGIVTREGLGAHVGRVLRARGGGMEWTVRESVEAGAAGGDAGCIEVGGSGRVALRCRYVPEELEADGDEPELPAGYHGALADYATTRLMDNGGRTRQQRGEMFYARYLQRRATLAPESAAWRDAVINKYG